VPSPDEVKNCSRHLEAEVRILRPQLVIPVGKLAIAQLYPELDKLTEIVGTLSRGSIAGHDFDVVALPHPSGVSTWHRTEPGKTLLARALALVERHEAWRELVAMQASGSGGRARAARPREATARRRTTRRSSRTDVPSAT
jgi:uracil-DNA glycosylase